MKEDNNIETTVKPALKHSPKESDLIKKRDSRVTWDVKQLEELEKYRLEHPITKHIDEPKTPYNVYEVIDNFNQGGDDEYLATLNEVNKIDPTSELLSAVSEKLLRDKHHFTSDEHNVLEKKELNNEEEDEKSNKFKLPLN